MPEFHRFLESRGNHDSLTPHFSDLLPIGSPIPGQDRRIPRPSPLPPHKEPHGVPLQAHLSRKIQESRQREQQLQPVFTHLQGDIRI